MSALLAVTLSGFRVPACLDGWCLFLLLSLPRFIETFPNASVATFVFVDL